MAVQLKQLASSSEAFPIDSTKLELIKRTICKGATDDELQLFIHACKKTVILLPFNGHLECIQNKLLKLEVLNDKRTKTI